MFSHNLIKHVPKGTGAVYWGPGDQVTFLATGAETNGAFFLCECLVPPGGGPPPHVHHREDESFYVQEGELTLHAGDQTLSASAGDFVHVPRGTVHSFRNTSTMNAKMLVLATPAGLEKFFEEAFDPAPERGGVPPLPSEALIARLMTVAPKHGMEILLPEELL